MERCRLMCASRYHTIRTPRNTRIIVALQFLLSFPLRACEKITATDHRRKKKCRVLVEIHVIITRRALDLEIRGDSNG